MPISSIILTENNINQQPNTFDASINSAPYNKLFLPIQNGANLKNSQISIQKINMYFSFPNITSSNYQAATVQWLVGGSYSSFSWNLTQNYNYATISQLNDALQAFCISNGLYLINGSSNVYYLTLVANPNSYGVDLTLFKVPTSLPVGYTQPANFAGYPTISSTPRITFKSAFNRIIGYTAGTLYDGVTTQTSYTSQFCPQLSPTSAILVACNIAFNPLALNGSSSVMNVFTTKDTAFGSMLVVEPQELVWYDINASSASQLIVEFYNQDYQPLNLLDPQITVQLLIRDKPASSLIV